MEYNGSRQAKAKINEELRHNQDGNVTGMGAIDPICHVLVKEMEEVTGYCMYIVIEIRHHWEICAERVILTMKHE